MTHISATPVRYLLPLSEQQRSILVRAMLADKQLHPHAWEPPHTPDKENLGVCPAEYLYARLESVFQNTGQFGPSPAPGFEGDDRSPVASRLMPLQVIMVHESLWHSALNDLLSVIMYTGCAAFGYWMQSQLLAGAGMVMSSVAMCFWIGNWRKRYTIDEARDALDKLEANFMEKRNG